MIGSLHTYYEESTDLYVVAFSFKVDPTKENVRLLERWCYDHYGIGFRSYTDRVTTSKSLIHARWCMDDIPYGELRFKNESDSAHFILFWALRDETKSFA